TRWSLLAILALGSPLAYLAAAAHPRSAPPSPTTPPTGPWLRQARTLPSGQYPETKPNAASAPVVTAGTLLAQSGNAPQSPATSTSGPWLQQAQTLLGQGKVDDAAAIAEGRLKVNPNDASALLIKAATLLRKGEFDA